MIGGYCGGGELAFAIATGTAIARGEEVVSARYD